MDRRSFMKQLGGVSGLAVAGPALANASEITASSPFSTPQHLHALSNSSRQRAQLTSTLAPWAPTALQPWDTHTINHLYRRAGVGATLAEIAAAKGKTPAAVIDALLDDSLLSTKMPADPIYSDKWLHVMPYLGSDATQQQSQMTKYYAYNADIRNHMAENLAKPEVMLREKMVQFWMNHLVIEEIKVYYPQIIYRYVDRIRRGAWGNFKQMIKDITVEAAMLYYLDGVYNYRTAPNENYARELLELFTLGVTNKDGIPNYTEDDIRAMAKALTGYTIDATAQPPNVIASKYVIAQHDATLKTIFGVKKQWGLASAGVADDIIDNLFDKKGAQVAWYICSKLYQSFVYHDISGATERAIIDQMAQTFVASNWELKPVLAQLLKSEHFFDEANIGANIKSPIEHVLGMPRQFDFKLDSWQVGSLNYYSAASGQALLDPPNVKGWPGYRTWISTTTLPYRNYLAYLLNVSSLPAYGADSFGKPNTAVTFSNELLTTWAKQLANYNGELDALISEISDYLCAQQPSSAAQAYIKGHLLPNAYEWSKLTDADKIIPLRTILYYTMSLADYQLS